MTEYTCKGITWVITPLEEGWFMATDGTSKIVDRPLERLIEEIELHDSSTQRIDAVAFAEPVGCIGVIKL